MRGLPPNPSLTGVLAEGPAIFLTRLWPAGPGVFRRSSNNYFGAGRRTPSTTVSYYDMGIRDIELGYRLKARGEQIRFYKDLEVKHLNPHSRFLRPVLAQQFVCVLGVFAVPGQFP